MATEGNNFQLENTIMRDAFFTESERKHFDVISDNLRKGKYVEGISYNTIGLNTFIELYTRANSKIDSLNTTEEDKLECHEEMRDLMGLAGHKKSRIINLIFAKEYAELYYKNNFLKNLLAETIIEMVDEGKFNEEQMKVVENHLGILLGSIENAHMSQELERDESIIEIDNSKSQKTDLSEDLDTMTYIRNKNKKVHYIESLEDEEMSM